MTNESPSSIPTPTKRPNRRLNFALLSVSCALLIGVLTWGADSYSPRESVLNPDPATCYYNELVQGFQSGQLNMNVATPPEFAKLADPYDPTTHNWSTGYWTNKVDTSYYNGKFYLYFGVTPALTLFWPYAALTGHYLSDRCAVAIFFAVSFLILWWLLWDIRRRYFSETHFGDIAPGIFLVGLVIGLTLYGSVHMVAAISGFTFAMLALAGIWLALHYPIRRNWYLLLASLSYGLAVGARPSLLFGAIILFVPVLQSWLEAPRTTPRRQTATSLLCASGPIAFIGCGLLMYNDLRFGSPFEFGWHYALTSFFEPINAKQFSLHYLWFNLRYYFLEPMSVSVHFPFLQDVALPAPPSGYAGGHGAECGSIPINYPFIIFVFALPLVWKNRMMREISPLRWFIAGLLLLFLTCALTDCVYMTADMRYVLDFLPALLLLAFIGFLGLDKALIHWPKRRHAVRLSWYLAVCSSLVFNIFTNLRTLAGAYSIAGSCLVDKQRPKDALKYLRIAVTLDPRQAMSHNELAVAYLKTGDNVDALTEVKMALEIDPNCSYAQYNLGSFLYLRGQEQEAYKYLEQALGADPTHTSPNYASVNLNIASMLVSNRDPGKWNGPLAIQFAEAACQESGYKNAYALLVSATICGRTGRTNEAISLAQKAGAAAKQIGDSNSLETAESILARYQNNQQLIQPSQGAIQEK